MTLHPEENMVVFTKNKCAMSNDIFEMKLADKHWHIMTFIDYY